MSNLSTSAIKSDIPKFPGKIMRPPPAPPKYLIATDSNGRQLKVPTLNIHENTMKNDISEENASKSSYDDTLQKYSNKVTKPSSVNSKYDTKSISIQKNQMGNISSTEIDPNTQIPLYVNIAPPKSLIKSPLSGHNAPNSSSAFERSKLMKLKSGILFMARSYIINKPPLTLNSYRRRGSS